MKIVERWAPWAAAAVLVAGLAAWAVTRGSNDTPAAPSHRAAALTSVERRVAREFIDTAVARKRLDRAWELTAPELRQGMSLAEWKTGTIPVVPYPVAQATVRLTVVSSFTDVAELRVGFLPRPGTKARPAAFRLGLRKAGDAWLVGSWLPASTVVPPKG